MTIDNIKNYIEIEEHLLAVFKENGGQSFEYRPNIAFQMFVKNARRRQHPLTDDEIFLLEYGVCMNHKHLVMMDMSVISDRNLVPKGRVANLIILAHEVAHVCLGEANQTLETKYSTFLMEKMTDLVAVLKLQKFPEFCEIYEYLRKNHNYKTKEGNFKNFNADIIDILTKDWHSTLASHSYMYKYFKGEE